MSAFDTEQMRTSEKISDMVMEYVSQFIARDFHEFYERACDGGAADTTPVIPEEFDEKIYKKITKLIKKRTGYNVRAVRLIFGFTAVAVCIICIVFTVMTLMNCVLRTEILDMVLSEIH